MQNILMPEYMKSFRCIGSQCNALCCQLWNVSVDDHFLNQINAINDNELLFILKKSLVIINDHNNNQIVYISMNENGRCPFLDHSDLCLIQKKIGEPFLASICYTYPRVINCLNGRYELSAVMSCPEIIRKAIFNPNKMVFIENQIPITNQTFINKTIDFNTLKDDWHPFLPSIIQLVIEIIQYRNVTIADRLLLIGFLFQKLQDNIDQCNYANLQTVILMYNDLLKNNHVDRISSQLSKNSLVKINTFVNLTLMRLNAEYSINTDKEKYQSYVSKILDGIHFQKDSDTQNILNYEQTLQTYAKDYFDHHEYIFENYLVNMMFKNVFPIKYSDMTIFEEYCMLIVCYTLLRFQISAIAGYQKQINQELIVQVMSYFSSVVDHDSNYINAMKQQLKDHGMLNMAYMSILLLE